MQRIVSLQRVLIVCLSLMMVNLASLFLKFAISDDFLLTCLSAGKGMLYLCETRSFFLNITLYFSFLLQGAYGDPVSISFVLESVSVFQDIELSICMEMDLHSMYRKG